MMHFGFLRLLDITFHFAVVEIKAMMHFGFLRLLDITFHFAVVEIKAD